MTTSMGPVPRPAVSEDLEQVVKIEAYSNKPPWSQEAFAKDLSKTGTHFWVLTDDETDEKVFAYAVFSLVADQAHLQTFAVDRSVRRRGHGLRILRFMINYVFRKGGTSVYLEVRKGNLAALALYQKLGFVVIRTMKSFYADGEDGYAMLYREGAKSEQDEDEEDASEGDDVVRSEKDFN